MPDKQEMLERSFNTFANPRFLSGNARQAGNTRKVIQHICQPSFIERRCQPPDVLRVSHAGPSAVVKLMKARGPCELDNFLPLHKVGRCWLTQYQE
jgi:hypothetical protein